MNKEYEINIFNIESIKTAENLLSSISGALQSDELMKFLGNKCMMELNRICNEKLNDIKNWDVFSEEVNKYKANHKLDVKQDELTISNDTMADLSHLSPSTLANYSEGFSIAKAIEFGTGILGTPDDESGWETKVNSSRDYNKNWSYERNGKLYWSNGFAGKFVYYELKTTVEKNIEDWINEYLESKIS